MIWSQETLLCTVALTCSMLVLEKEVHFNLSLTAIYSLRVGCLLPKLIVERRYMYLDLAMICTVDCASKVTKDQ